LGFSYFYVTVRVESFEFDYKQSAFLLMKTLLNIIQGESVYTIAGEK